MFVAWQIRSSIIAKMAKMEIVSVTDKCICLPTLPNGTLISLGLAFPKQPAQLIACCERVIALKMILLLLVETYFYGHPPTLPPYPKSLVCCGSGQKSVFQCYRLEIVTIWVEISFLECRYKKKSWTTSCPRHKDILCIVKKCATPRTGINCLEFM